MYQGVHVTGGSGFLGTALAEVLPGAHFIGRKVVDLTHPAATAEYFQRHKPDVVVHMAARVGGIRANMRCPADFLIDNVRIDANVCDAVRRSKPRHFIAILSTCMYPDSLAAHHYPMGEHLLEAGPPPPTNAAYAAAKRALWHGCQALHEQYGVPYTCLVPANLYGPYDHFGSDDAHFLATALWRVQQAAAQRAPRIEFFGTGQALRQYVYVRDVAWLIQRLVDTGPLNQTLNVAPEAPLSISIADLAHEVAKAADYSGQVAFSGVGPDGQLRKDVSTARLRQSVPDWQARETPLQQGLRETLAWLRLNPPKAAPLEVVA